MELDSYKSCQFSHWQDNGATANERTFTASGAQTFVGVYTCSTPTNPAGGSGTLFAGAGPESAILLFVFATTALSVTMVSSRTDFFSSASRRRALAILSKAASY